MKGRSFFFVIISAFLCICNSHLFNRPHNIYIPEMRKISELPNAYEGLLNYINEADQNFENDPENFSLYINLLRSQDNLQSVMNTFVNKVKYLKEDIINKVVHEAMDVVDVNKEVLADMVKIFKDITKKVKNGAQIVEIMEVTNDIVLYTNLTFSNLFNEDQSYKKTADRLYEKIKDEIAKGTLREHEEIKEDIKKFVNNINKQMKLLENELKVIVQKAKEIKKSMIDVIKLKPMLEKKFKHTKIHKIK